MNNRKRSQRGGLKWPSWLSRSISSPSSSPRSNRDGFFTRNYRNLTGLFTRRLAASPPLRSAMTRSPNPLRRSLSNPMSVSVNKNFRFHDSSDIQKSQCSNGLPKPIFDKRSVRAPQFYGAFQTRGSLGCDNAYPTYNPDTEEYCCSPTPTDDASMIEWFNMIIVSAMDNISGAANKRQIEEFVTWAHKSKKYFLKKNPSVTDPYPISDDDFHKWLSDLDHETREHGDDMPTLREREDFRQSAREAFVRQTHTRHPLRNRPLRKSTRF